jgi:hypothetical protein
MINKPLKMQNPRIAKLDRLEWLRKYKSQASPTDEALIKVIMTRWGLSRKIARDYLQIIT